MSDLQDHPEYRQLVNAVRAAPDDDLPRLVLADWLEEHDSPDWAEFIRVHCEAARFPHAARIWDDTFTDADAVHPDWQRALTCARLVRELWPKVAYLYSGRWDERLNTRVEVNGLCVVDHPRREFHQSFGVSRGLTERVACSVWEWVGETGRRAIGPQLLARQPVREVAFTERDRANNQGDWIACDGPPFPNRFHSWPQSIPWCVARRLRATLVERQHGYGHKLYQFFIGRPAEALAALSDAALAWALEEARQASGAT